MGAFSVPVRVSCSGGLGVAGPSGAPSLSLSLNLDISVAELLASFLEVQRSNEPGIPSGKPGAEEETKSVFLLPEDPEVASNLRLKDESTKSKDASKTGSEVVTVQAQSPQLAAWEVLPLTPAQLSCRTVRVTNLIRGLRKWELQDAFTSQVGPVESCVVSESFAQIDFSSAEHAFSAVQKFDGSLLEVAEESQNSAKDRNVSLIPVPWSGKGNVLRQLFSNFVHPLEQCHYRRGDRWLTLAEVSKVKEGQNKVEYKGSIIKVTLDSTDPE